ncbi:MAG: ferritin family protein [Candidatus Margulisbacteria bacterium]|nr:ferritin family protein [Candidatus Margulisiibacteriota bacterium]
MYDLLADVKLSIDLEEKGLTFYSQTAAKAKNPLAASTLSSLADREKEHMVKIKEFYENLSGSKKLESGWLMAVEFPPSKQALLGPIIAKLKANLDKKFESDKDINDAYLIAEGLERDSFNLYEKISKETTDDTARKFYAALALEEREHFSILEDTLLYLNDPGEWYRLQERWIVEG